MMIHLFRQTQPTRSRRTRLNRPSFVLEGLEERTVMSVATMAHVVPAAQVAAPVSNSAKVNVPITISSITIGTPQNPTGTVQNTKNLVTGAVGTVTGTIAGQQFTTPLTITGAAAKHGVSVLSLHLGPIQLDVLGLQVQTSEICLNITAQPGKGNLLGNLVAGLANALNGTQSATGTGLLNTLNGLLGTAGNATTVTGALNSLLTTTATGAKNTGSSSILGLLNSGLMSGLSKMTAATPTTAQNILHLRLGPVNLNLLGLVVNLDNCHGGPVTVDINAIPGSGNLLGNLLVAITHALDSQSLLTTIDNALITALGNVHA